MRTRTLGHSGIEVSEIGIGTWGLSGEAYGPIEPGIARATLESAIGSGATFVETAACYGPEGAVETMIGEVLRDRGRECAFVSTRLGVDRESSNGMPQKRFDTTRLTAMAEASLRRLGTDHVDAFLLHNPLAVTLGGSYAMDALRALRDSGKTRLIGVSVGSLDSARMALKHGIDVLELPYNLLYPRLLHAIAPDLATSRVGIIARSPLAYGLLADTWAADRRFADHDHRVDRWAPAELAKRVRQREAVRHLVHDEIKTLREAAVRFVLSNHLVNVVVIGARTPSQAEENSHLADTLPYLPGADLAGIGGKLDAAGIEV